MSRTTFGLIFGCVGIVALNVGIFLYVRLRGFLAKAQSANGVITSLHTTSDDDGQEMYAPVVDFRTQSGQPATYRSTLFSRPCKYKVGDQVEVLYDPEKPDYAQIKGRVMNYMPTIIVGGLGVIFTVVGLIVMFIPE